MQYSKVATCGDRLKKALEVRGVKAVELSKMTDINKSAISQYIKGTYEPKQDRIQAMAQALNVSEGWLMGLDVPMDAKPTPHTEPDANFRLSYGESKLVALFREVPEADRDMVVNMVESALASRRGEKATEEILNNIHGAVANIQTPHTIGVYRGMRGRKGLPVRGMKTVTVLKKVQK